MTNDDIIRMAREVGAERNSDFPDWSFEDDTLQRFAALVAAAEREACAVAAWSTGRDLYMKQHDAPEVGMACAAAIRARGEKG